jgi:hypothetical protein
MIHLLTAKIINIAESLWLTVAIGIIMTQSFSMIRMDYSINNCKFTGHYFEVCKPQPQGKPGYLRADTIHQGGQEGQKGVYHINTVDELTQWR